MPIADSGTSSTSSLMASHQAPNCLRARVLHRLHRGSVTRTEAASNALKLTVETQENCPSQLSASSTTNLYGADQNDRAQVLHCLQRDCPRCTQPGSPPTGSCCCLNPCPEQLVCHGTRLNRSTGCPRNRSCPHTWCGARIPLGASAAVLARPIVAARSVRIAFVGFFTVAFVISYK